MNFCFCQIPLDMKHLSWIDEVRIFDQEHAGLFERIADNASTILHRVDLHILQFRSTLRKRCLTARRSALATRTAVHAFHHGCDRRTRRRLLPEHVVAEHRARLQPRAIQEEEWSRRSDSNGRPAHYEIPMNPRNNAYLH